LEDRVNNLLRSLPLCAALGVAAPAAVLAQAAGDPELAQFRSAYTSGEGFAYVVIKDDQGERVYRYGDVSRLTAKKDPRGYVLFTCALPHVFAPERAQDRAALKRAEVVKAGDPRFAELDAKYLAGCHNPFVKSALPKPKGAS
jgi:hypothetical protein